MFPDDTWSIGELAERAGTTVKTVRFYSDRGLLPEPARSAGGHRRYGPGALDRLRLILSLRTLDLPVAEVGRVLGRDDAGDDAREGVPDGGLNDALEDVIAEQLREVGSRLAALRWREAALQLLRDCTAEERPERLRLIGAVSAPPDTAALARFWRGALPARLPARLVSAIQEAAIPQPPADPSPAQVLAFARLYAVVAGPCPGTGPHRPPARRPEDDHRPAVLYDGLREAYTLAVPDLRARRSPYQGGALDCFVSAHARSRGVRDTPAFRRRLSGVLAQAAHPVMDRYWRLAGELAATVPGPPEPTLGAAHDWLRAALDAQVAGLPGSAR